MKKEWKSIELLVMVAFGVILFTGCALMTGRQQLRPSMMQRLRRK